MTLLLSTSLSCIYLPREDLLMRTIQDIPFWQQSPKLPIDGGERFNNLSQVVTGGSQANTHLSGTIARPKTEIIR